jgi:ankyrin repeat protein
MSNAKLPERSSLEFLKKLAKDRLRELRLADPRARLADALLAVARDHGFPSWRALKAEVERRQTDVVTRFFTACANGDVDAMRSLLASDERLARATDPAGQYPGWTGLHVAAQRGHAGLVRLLLEHGADPNAREGGDNTYPLHWAAARRDPEIARLLLDAGGDPHGIGDVHELDAIGWATFFTPEGDQVPKGEVWPLLVDRGARHHIFSAIAVGDLDLIRSVVEQNPDALDRRMSRFEHRLTPLHAAIARKRCDILDVLLELGADPDAPDAHGQTALASAIVRGDREAIGRLRAAGATPPAAGDSSNFRERMADMGGSVKKSIPMIMVPDVAAALEWYTSIGFKELGRFADDSGYVNWGMVAYGNAELMLNMHGTKGRHDVSLWFYTTRVDEMYRLVKSRQLEAAQAALADTPGASEPIDVAQEIYNPSYGGREFCIRDLNGFELYFRQDTVEKE